MATNDVLQKRLEKKGWKFQFVHSTATQHLQYAPVIARKGNIYFRGTSFSDVCKQIRNEL